MLALVLSAWPTCRPALAFSLWLARSLIRLANSITSAAGSSRWLLISRSKLTRAWLQASPSSSHLSRSLALSRLAASPSDQSKAKHCKAKPSSPLPPLSKPANKVGRSLALLLLLLLLLAGIPLLAKLPVAGQSVRLDRWCPEASQVGSMIFRPTDGEPASCSGGGGAVTSLDKRK